MSVQIRSQFTSTSSTSAGFPQASIEALFGSPKKPRNFKQWEEMAREQTEMIQKHGSLSPLVLVKGKNIPANAIIAGVEKRNALYIARTYYEGVLCVGKAGHHLEKGAAIPYNGQEVHVDTYEVLVPAMETVVRYRVSETIHMPSIPRMAQKVEASAVIERAPIVALPPKIECLNLIKMVILIDDSASMAGALWRDARKALAGIVDLNGQVSSDGVDLFFMNNEARYGINVKGANEVHSLFDSVRPEGETPLGTKLGHLFARYIPLIEHSHSSHRPIVMVVITDGEPTDEPEEVIVEAARRLDRNRVDPKQFGLQFIQIGNDPDATEFLKDLDDDLHVRYDCRDIVDATPFNEQDAEFTVEKMVNILLTSIERKFEVQTSRSSTLIQQPMKLAGVQAASMSSIVSSSMSLESRSDMVEQRTTTRVISSPVPSGLIARSETLEGYTTSTIVSSPLTSFSSTIVSVPRIERLGMIKTVVILDDSGSMSGSRWLDAREVFAGIVEMTAKFSSEGVDLFFMNDKRNALNLKEMGHVRRLLDSVQPLATVEPLGSKLKELFARYLPLLEDTARQYPPITFVVVLDGEPSDKPNEAIVEAWQRLENKKVSLDRFNIQFVQVGDDAAATRYLQGLKADLAKRSSISGVIETTPFNAQDPRFTIEKLTKILVNSTERPVSMSSSRSSWFGGSNVTK